MKELVKTLSNEFSDKEYAHAYIEEFSNMEIAAQIKALREQRNLTQRDLAQLAGMKQERVSALEDIDYDAWTVKTLRKLGKAFDLTVKLSFETFSSRILDADRISKNSLERLSREKDLEVFENCGFSEVNEINPWTGGVKTSTVVHLSSVNDIVAANEDWHGNAFPSAITTA